MECIEARALKSRFLSTVKTNSEVIYNNDDVWCLTRINSVASDDFAVEELLNLEEDEGFAQEDEGFEKGIANFSSSSSSYSGADELDSLSVGELSVPVEDLENLEWLSEIVNDSTASESSLLYPDARSFTAAKAAVTSVDAVNTSPTQIFPSSVPSKARSKRSLKPNGRLWSLPSPLPLSSAADSSSTLSSSSHGSSIISSLVPITSEAFSGVEKPPAKRPKKPDGDSCSITGRRCMHCQVQKTPQWRTGPQGPKTLCNACGVRFKSGRLFPEYRPACSPTFSQEVHSNSHRKVLEMRRLKESAVQSESQSG